MAGFADVEDLAFLRARDVARRMGFSRWSSLARWLAARGSPPPPCIRRGWYRAGDVKDWFAGLSTSPADATPAAGNQAIEAFPAAAGGALPGHAAASVHSIAAARMRRRMGL